MAKSNDGSSSDDALIRAIARVSDDFASPPQSERAIDSRVGRFVLRGKLGRGGMGIVYRALDPTLGRHVALKVLPAEREGDADRRARFLREARSAAAVVHPNVATIHEVGEAESNLFIAMELVGGVTLRARFITGRPLPAEEVIDFAKGILRGLAAAHAEGIVHRDLKPENVMVDREKHLLKILDFGLAKFRDVRGAARDVLEHQPTDGMSTAEGHILGTPAYMSPEQAAGKPLDERSDLFSLGTLLYEALTGGRPFGGDTTVETLAAVIRDTPVPLLEANPAVPPELATLVMRCLAKAPADRFDSARSMLAALEALVSTPARRASRPRTLAVIAASVGVAVVVAALIAVRSSPATRAAPIDPPVNPPDASSPLIRLIDLPLPESRSEEALREYRRGMQAYYDASLMTAADGWRKAVALDDELAEAHMRLAIHARGQDLAEARHHLERAWQLRSRLHPRDLAILTMAQDFLFARTPQRELMGGRFDELAATFPNDVEIKYEACARFDDERVEVGGPECFERVHRLDPPFALVLWAKSSSEHGLGRYDDARMSAQRCVQQTPGAASCFSVLAGIASELGDCAGMIEAARSRNVAESGGMQGYGFLAEGLASQRVPRVALESSLQRKWMSIAPERREIAQLMDEAHVATLYGDLDEAVHRLRALRELISKSDSEPLQAAVWGALIATQLEAGEIEAGRIEARRYWTKRPAWSDDGTRASGLADVIVRPYDSTLWIAKILVNTGDVTAASFDDERAAWLLRRPGRGPQVPAAFAWTANTREDAESALVRLLEETSGENAGITERGKVLALLGRFQDAIPELRKDLRKCEALTYPLEQTQLMLWLGRALEETGDVAGACGQYASILERWGTAKPRSVTAEQARTRRSALRCHL